MYKQTETKLENTSFEVREENGKIIFYRIRPREGYKLHEISLDEIMTDENGIETGKKKLGFTEVYVTAGANYDFEKNAREIYAVPIEYEAEIVDISTESAEIEEKAKAYDILMGVDE